MFDVKAVVADGNGGGRGRTCLRRCWKEDEMVVMVVVVVDVIVERERETDL